MSYLGGKIFAADLPSREPRERGLVRARILVDRIPVQDIIIRNLSRRGIGAVSRGAPLFKDERATVLFPDDRELTGIVSWVNGPSFGIKLDRELDPQTLTQIVQRQIELTGVSADWEVKRLHRVTPALIAPGKLRRL